jgi:hypothetical protein
LAKLHSEFSNDPGARRAMWMLDGDDRSIFFEEGDKHKRYRVDQKILWDALRRYSPERKFSPFDLHIRDSLDRFLVYIEEVDRAIENGLIDKDEAYPYFFYWIKLLNDPGETTEDEEARKRVLDYINVIGFKHVERFLARWPSEKVE